MPFIGKLPDVGAFRLIDSITTSATDTYALQVEGLSYFPSSARNLIVSLNGVTQAPESAYTVSGSNIVFASALTASDVIDYILVIGESVDIGTPSDNTVGNAQLKSDLDFSGKTLTFSADQISGDAINGGTISSFASTGIDDNAVSTAITIDSSQDVTFTSDAKFPDNGKAIFGAGNDLQIYHSGSHSFIADAGTGDLYIGASNNIALMNAAFSENKLLATTDGALNLYYDGSQKLATTATGINVTGDVNSDSVTTGTFTSTGIDDNATSTAITIDSSERVGIGITSLVNPLHVGVTSNTASKTSGSAFDGGALRLDGGLGGADSEVAILGGSNDGLSSGIGFARQDSSTWATQIRFYTHGTGITTTDELTERMRLDGSGNLLVGTTVLTDVSSSGTGNEGAYIKSDGSVGLATSNDKSLIINRKTTDGDLVEFRKDGTTVGSIASQGGTGLRLNSQGATGFLQNGGSDKYTWSDSAFAPANDFARDLGSASYRFRNLYMAGDAVMGASNNIIYQSGTTFNVRAAVANLTFQTNGANERMRIDSSGRVGIGTSSPSTNAMLHIHKADTNRLYLTSTSNAIQIIGDPTATGMFIDNESDTASDIVFRNTSAYAERMRIASDGQVLIGTSSILSGGIDGIHLNTAADTGITFAYSGTVKGWLYYIVGAAMQLQTPTGTTIRMVSDSNGVQLTNGATSWSSLSDERKKDIIEPITNAAEKVSTLRTVIGKYKEEDEGTRRAFLIAQDVQKVLPEAVGENDDGDLLLQYTETIPLLVAAIKEQQAQITELKAEVAALKGAN